MLLAPEFTRSSARLVSRLPAHLRRSAASAWASANLQRVADSFLEGPCFDASGNLLMVDIPFGRILCLSPSLQWDVLAEYDGWPNGLKVEGGANGPGRTALVTDFRRGLLRLHLASGELEDVLSHRHSESFRGLNDLTCAGDGSIYFTDQGQSGLHDPCGRVFRLHQGKLDILLDRIPSPNGLALNPAQNQLYLAVTRANAIWRIPLQPDGGVSKVGLWIQLSGGTGPDGMAVDAAGNLYVAHIGLGCVWVFNPRGEAVLRIDTPGDLPTNLAIHPQRAEIYITEASRGEVLVHALVGT